MKKICLLLFISLLTGARLLAQPFITSGIIEYEVKTNSHKKLEDEEGWLEQLKDEIPKFSTDYYKYYFANNTSLYKFDRKAATDNEDFGFDGGGEENLWYNDYTAGTYSTTISLDGQILMQGPQRKMHWKVFPSDRRTIAGFNCRKAQTILFDSVYVFVYYTDEIKISGGPMRLHGLPGMILGVTIPRLYTSWIATTVQLQNPEKLSILQRPTKGTPKTENEIIQSLRHLGKSWSANANSKKWFDQMYWRIFL